MIIPFEHVLAVMLPDERICCRRCLQKLDDEETICLNEITQGDIITREVLEECGALVFCDLCNRRI